MVVFLDTVANALAETTWAGAGHDRQERHGRSRGNSRTSNSNASWSRKPYLWCA